MNNSRILRLRYEDFVLEHVDCKEKIYQFLNIKNPSKKSQVRFDPENSKKNIGLWKEYSDMPEIRKISTELAEFCYQK